MSTAESVAEFRRWLAEHQKLAAPSIKAYCNSIKRWLESGLPPGVWLMQTDATASSSTQRQNRAALRAWERFGAVELPGALPKCDPHHSRPRFVLDEAEIQRFLGQYHSHSHRDRAIVNLLYDTGIRNAEVRDATLDGLNIEGRELMIAGKGGKRRTVYFGLGTRALLSGWLRLERPHRRGAASPLLFLAHDAATTSYRADEQEIVRLVRWGYRAAALAAGEDAGKRFAQAAGDVPLLTLPDGTADREARPVHLLRRCTATHLWRGGMDIADIQQLLGHESIETTRRYIVTEGSRAKYDAHHPSARLHGRAGLRIG